MAEGERVHPCVRMRQSPGRDATETKMKEERKKEAYSVGVLGKAPAYAKGYLTMPLAGR